MSGTVSYFEAVVIGLVQGVSELFPVSSLGHNVLIPALVGSNWARDLNVSSPRSPYLAFIVGLHVATAIGITAYFWRDWLRIIGGFFSSIRYREIESPDQKLAWMIILATIPVGLAGLLFEHVFRVLFGRPSLAAIFLVVNGGILYAAERCRPRKSREADEVVLRELAEKQAEELTRDRELEPERELELVGAAEMPADRSADRATAHSSGQRVVRQQEAAAAVASDHRIASHGDAQALIVGSAQVLALLAGISRDGVTMAAGMFRGMSREDAARFAFLLATPVILAAGVLKIPDLLGPLGNGIRPQILAGSIVSGIGAYLSVRFLTKYFKTRTLTPFAVYCVVFGLGSLIYLGLR